MRKLFGLFLATLLIFVTFVTPAGGNPAPYLSAQAAILIDAETGQVLFEKSAGELRPPASTTKILTAIMGIESSDLQRVFEVHDHSGGLEGSSANLYDGQKVTMDLLVRGALVVSGNDAASAIAHELAGSEAIFAQLMNFKAWTIGAVHTHFVNPHGLPNKEHRTTANDLARLARYALRNPHFADIVNNRQDLLKWPDKNSQSPISNTNDLLWSYSGADGVKTGTTNAAGKCLVASATRNNWQLITVVLKSGSRFSESARLLDYGFNNFRKIELVKKGEIITNIPVEWGQNREVKLISDGQLKYLLPAGPTDQITRKIITTGNLQAPVANRQVVGRLAFYHNAQEIGQVDLITTKEVKALNQWEKILRKLRFPGI